MTVFLIVAALMLATALCFVLPPLLRNESKERSGTVHILRDALNLDVLRDQLRELDADRAAGTIDAAGYESARHDLEQRVVEDVHPDLRPATTASAAAPGKLRQAVGVGIVLSVVAVSLYALLGNPAGLDPSKFVPENAQQNVTPEQIAAMVGKLAAHLKEKPDDAEGWAMLARSYSVLNRFDEAADAYAHLVKLAPPDAGLLADYADALAMSLNRSLQGPPEKIIAQALQLDPKNIKALALSGAASFERHDYPAAIVQWRKAVALVPADSDMARSINASIDEAQAAQGTPNVSAANASAAATVAANANAAPAANGAAGAAGGSGANGAQVSGMVELDPSLRSQVSDGDTVFIYARAVDGPRFPLAVLRKQVKDLPTPFTLDDSMSMMPNAKLSGFADVVIGARISKSGSATPGAGDLEGISETVHPGARDLKIKINSQRK